MVCQLFHSELIAGMTLNNLKHNKNEKVFIVALCYICIHPLARNKNRGQNYGIGNKGIGITAVFYSRTSAKNDFRRSQKKLHRNNEINGEMELKGGEG